MSRMVANPSPMPAKEQPIITAINGHAVGLGATLALGGDITVMSATARIGDPHVKVGLVAGDGGAVLWPLLVGPSRAKEFLLRGNLIDGVEAERIGLVNHVRPVDEVVPLAREIAEEIAGLPPMAVRWTKLSVNRWLKDVYQHTFDVSIVNQDDSEVQRGYKALLLSKVPLDAVTASKAPGAAARPPG